MTAPRAEGAPGVPSWVFRVALGLVLAPLAVSAAHLSIRYGNDYNPGGDMALLEMVTRDVGRHAVLIGPYSRGGWHHPGPATYYVFAVPYRLLGSTATAMNVAALAVNGASVAGMAVLARRRGGPALMLATLVGAALLMRSLGPDELRLPWNPFVTVLPYGVLVFLAWSLTCRDRWALPLAVFVASYLAQTHVGYVVLALPVLAFGAVWLLVATVVAGRRGGDGDGARPPSGRGLAAPGLTSIGVAVVLWLGPAIEQITTRPGNLRLAIRWFRDGGEGGEPAQGVRAGWRIVSAQFGVPPEWLWGWRGVSPAGEPPYLDSPMLPVLLLVVAGAVIALWRGRLPGARRLVAVWLAASLCGLVATARIIGPVYTYRVGWARVLAMVAGVIVLWAVWTAVARRRPALERRLLVPGALAVLGVLAVVSSVAHVRAGVPQRELSDRVGEVVPAAVAALPPGDGPVLVDGTSSFDGLVNATSIVLQLERRGVVAVLPAGDTAAGTHRMDDGGRLRARLIVADAATIGSLGERADLTLVAFGSDRSLEEVRSRAATGQPFPAGAALALFLDDPR